MNEMKKNTWSLSGNDELSIRKFAILDNRFLIFYIHISHKNMIFSYINVQLLLALEINTIQFLKFHYTLNDYSAVNMM